MNRKQLIRIFTAAAAGVLGGTLSSCSTASSEAWNKIQNEGLIPYIAENQASRGAADSEAPQEVKSERLPVERQVSSRPPLLSGPVVAEEVSGKPGFVYSPHTEERLQIDVRDYAAGTRVRCPYTKRSFVTPGAPVMAPQDQQPTTQMAAQTRPERSEPTRSRSTQRVASSIKKKPRQRRVASVSRNKSAQPKPSPRPKPAVQKIPMRDLEPVATRSKQDAMKMSSAQTLDLPKPAPEPQVPSGKRVPGKPNYVYSPFAASNQVVDVEGMEAGTKVKCPYTSKVFKVPAKAAPAVPEPVPAAPSGEATGS